jgi:predicted AAA+ superfamily ATPase
MVTEIKEWPLYPRVYKALRQSFFLFGPRGVGKSTWARQCWPAARRIDLLDEGLYQAYLVDPETFAAEMRTLSQREWVVVDEIQRLPGLLNQVHRFIEESRLRFVMLGSSARKLKTSGTNLLAGRALKKTMYPLLPEELGADFSLERVLTFGSLPVITQAESKEEALRAYVELYLKEEIRAEALVRNLGGFSRFLPIAALFHSQVINTAALARDAGVARTTVNGYMDILEDTLLAFRLPALETRLRVRERKHPKLYWIDPGLVRAIKKHTGSLASEERGALLEGWVAVLLKAYGEIGGIQDEMYYWAPAESRQTEVDFILKRGREYLAIEVKSGARISNRELAGLRAVKDLPQIARRILLYNGKREMKTADGIDIWPISIFTRVLATGRLWP